MPDTNTSSTAASATATAAPSRPVVVTCPFCNTPNRVDLAKLSAGPRCGSCKRPLHLDRPQKTTDAEFDRMIRGAGGGVPVIVDFYADWCGPCHVMAPTLDEFASSHAGDVLVAKLDTDANPGTAGRFGIRGIPTLIAFRNGKEIKRHVGVADRKQLDALIA